MIYRSRHTGVRLRVVQGKYRLRFALAPPFPNEEHPKSTSDDAEKVSAWRCAASFRESRNSCIWFEEKGRLVVASRTNP